MSWPDPEKFEITCYLAWGGAEVTYRLGSKGEYEAVRRALGDMLAARHGGKAADFFSLHPGYYAFDDGDRAAFDEIMRGKGV
ncbi:MAG: hypothetical protein WDO17_11165 [Alphaproteobacteria bacterium]